MLALIAVNPSIATVAEAKGSHAIYVSQPKAVDELIEKAAMSLSTK